MKESEDKITTLNPDKKKKGVNIDRDKYDTIKSAIIKCLRKQELTAFQIFDLLKQSLDGNFDGSINWYGETVKLDLEARGLIERIPDTKPQLYRLIKK